MQYNYDKYCRIIMVHERPMFVAFLGNSCPQIYLPANVYAITCLIFQILLSNLRNYVPTNQKISGYPPTLTPRIKMSPQLTASTSVLTCEYDIVSILQEFTGLPVPKIHRLCSFPTQLQHATIRVRRLGIKNLILMYE